jgi:type VI secretion system protein ImpC
VKPFNFGEVNLTAGGDDDRAIPADETPFCVAIIGDFGGGSRGDLGERPALLIDRDNFEEVLGKIGPEIQLPLNGDDAPVRLAFSELDDFHPDQIFERSGMFQRLRDLRALLSDPSTFPAAAAELGLAADRQSPAKPTQTNTPTAASIARLATGSLLDESIEQTQGRPVDQAARRAPDELQEFVRRVTEPHLAVADSDLQAEVISVLDRAASAQMRSLLHSPNFQALEAAWRAAFLLVRRIETDARLKLYLIDISAQELKADLASPGPSKDLHASGLYRRLVEKSVGTPGAEPWAVIVGNYSFGPSREDAELLERIARIAQAAGAPFIAGASPQLLGTPSLPSAPHPRDWKPHQDTDGARAWDKLRRLPEASAVGLALPRFLLRLPYGEKTASVESFEFEEMPNTPAHEDYLWGNAAFACGLLLAESFKYQGRAMRPGAISDIDGLPLHAYERDGESQLKPCAEILLTGDAVEHILENGLMPLVSLKGRDLVRLARFQSIAEPPRPLAGPWDK